MQKIFKYVIPIMDEVTLDLPADSKLLTAKRGTYKGEDCFFLYALVSPDYYSVPVKFRVVGTGNPFDIGNFEYLTTEGMGNFVWHLFYQPVGGIRR